MLEDMRKKTLDELADGWSNGEDDSETAGGEGRRAAAVGTRMMSWRRLPKIAMMGRMGGFKIGLSDSQQ